MKARVVSMPSWELFDTQPAAYRDEVLPTSVTARVAIEQAFDGRLGALRGRERRDRRHGHVRGRPLKHLQTKFGFTPEAVVGLARERVGHPSGG